MSRDGIRDSGRRRFPRLAVDRPVPVVDLTLNSSMTMDDVSLGGFRSRSPVPTALGERHRFRVHHPAMSAEMVARAVYCRPTEGDPAYAIGWQWGTDSITAEARRRLLTAIEEAQRIARRSAGTPRTPHDGYVPS